MNKTLKVCYAAMIAACYLVLTWICSALGLASGVIQLRLSEALNVLCLFEPAAIFGVSIGCLLSNLLTGCAFWDVIFGTLATVLGAVGVRLLRKCPVLALFSPVVTNSLILPFVFRWVYATPGALWYFALTVFIGETLSCVAAGFPLYRVLKKRMK